MVEHNLLRHFFGIANHESLLLQLFETQVIPLSRLAPPVVELVHLLNRLFNASLCFLAALGDTKIPKDWEAPERPPRPLQCLLISWESLSEKGLGLAAASYPVVPYPGTLETLDTVSAPMRMGGPGV